MASSAISNFRFVLIVSFIIFYLALNEFLRQVSGVGKAFPAKSTDLYRKILGISSLREIVNVELDMKAKRVVIRAEMDRTTEWGHPNTKQAVIIWLQACGNVTIRRLGSK